MLTKEKHALVQALIDGSSKEELIWINGYLSGFLKDQSNEIVRIVSADKNVVKKLTIAYGTETGNSKKLATDLATKAKKKNIQTKVVSLDQYRLTDLTKEEYFLTVISTQGEGEPPVSAQKFYDHIHQNGFQLNNLKYSVLALGDTSYPLFCKAGEDVDNQLQKLGGKRIVPIQKCDVDYDADADRWFENVLTTLQGPAATVPLVPVTPVNAPKTSGKTIYQGTILSHTNLNDRGSNKETWHIEIAADGVLYEAGDSIGIVPKNDQVVVDAIITLTGVDPARKISFKGDEFSIAEILTNKLNISNLNDKVVKRYAAIVQQEIPQTRIDLLDLLRIYPVKDVQQFEEILQILNPQSPRLYTVASSPLVHADEVHITVARDVFWINEEKKFGICSDFLSRLSAENTIEFFVQKNKRFKLPAADKDVIMIGPGTGIAAFRSFLAERDASGASGRNWLFFGEQYFASDFLYQTEIQNWKDTGVLTNINLAFSRDQEEKIYVQHRMLQHGAELYEWIAGGAYIYICGKKDPMSIEVENTLLRIIEQYGNKTPDEAKAFFSDIKDAHRYHKDVY